MATRELSDFESLRRGVCRLDDGPTECPRAWDWHANAAAGLAVLQEHLRIALVVENRIRVKFPNLRALTGEERENMALVGYGGFALTDQRLYYVPSADGSTWVENAERHWRGIAYVALVCQNVNRH